MVQAKIRGRRGQLRRPFSSARVKGSIIMAIQARERGWLVRKSAAGIAIIAALAVASGAMAQQEEAAQAPPPVPERAAWVKHCGKEPVTIKKNATAVRDDKAVCLTQHERVDGNSGALVISAAIRQIEGENNQRLMIMIGRQSTIDLQPGLRATFYSKQAWENVLKNPQKEDAKCATRKLQFKWCHPDGCTAEVELDSKFKDLLISNDGLMVFSTSINGKTSALPVPLAGFVQALEGPPMDRDRYNAQYRTLMVHPVQRQQVLFEEFKKQQEAEAAKRGKGAAPAPAAEKKR